jgi:hypothetical protein
MIHQLYINFLIKTLFYLNPTNIIGTKKMNLLRNKKIQYSLLFGTTLLFGYGMKGWYEKSQSKDLSIIKTKYEEIKENTILKVNFLVIN